MKKVRFSDKIQIHNMNISLKDHALEVKNPRSFVVNTSNRDSPKNISSIIFWGFVIFLVFCVWIFF